MSEPTPILFTIPNFITAGSGRAMLNVIRRLNPVRFAPAVAVLRKGGPLDAEVESNGWPLYEFPFALSARPRWSLPARAWRSARHLPLKRYRLWHSFHYADDYTEAIVARLSGAKAWVFTKKNMSWGSRAWKLRSLLASRIAAQNTNMMSEFFNTGRLRDRAVLIPCSVETDRFRPDVPQRLGLRRSLGLAEGEPLLGAVGNLIQLKGHDVAIKALGMLPHGTLVIAGPGEKSEYAQGLLRLAAERGLSERVRLLGSVSDIPAFLVELDIFLHPTTAAGQEGCPVAVLEALSSGCPVVASEVSGSRDIIEDGVVGRLVSPDDPRLLADALAALIEDRDRRVAFGLAGRERVLSSYRVDQEAAAYGALYEEVMQGA